MKWQMEDKIKHRIIGLTVVISTLVIVSPVLFKESNRHFEDSMAVSFKLPKKPVIPHVSIVNKDKLFKQVKVAKITIPATAELYTATAHKAISLSQQAQQVNKERNPTSPILAQSKAILSQLNPNPTFYTIQLATFSNQANAAFLVETLRSKGFKATVQKVDEKQGYLYHVNVGQLNRRDKAVDLQRDLVNNTQLNGIIIKTKVS